MSLEVGSLRDPTGQRRLGVPPCRQTAQARPPKREQRRRAGARDCALLLKRYRVVNIRRPYENRVGTVAGTTLVIVLGLAPAAAEQQPQLSAADAETVKKEVTAAVDRYYRLFSEQNKKALPEEVFLIPWIVIGGNGAQADLTKKDALARFEGSLKQLVESGWGKSVFTTDFKFGGEIMRDMLVQTFTGFRIRATACRCSTTACRTLAT